jgi:hypothetical protein
MRSKLFLGPSPRIEDKGVMFANGHKSQVKAIRVVERSRTDLGERGDQSSHLIGEYKTSKSRVGELPRRVE